jgi:hypothetical protein
MSPLKRNEEAPLLAKKGLTIAFRVWNASCSLISRKLPRIYRQRNKKSTKARVLLAPRARCCYYLIGFLHDFAPIQPRHSPRLRRRFALLPFPVAP